MKKEKLEISAKTVEEAIQRALEQLGVSREEVEVTVLKEGKSGILGMGAEEAKIRVRPLISTDKKKTDIVEMAKSIVEALLAKLEMVASVTVKALPSAEGSDEANAPITFDVTGDDLGILIGRHGQTLASLQYIARIIVAHQTKSWLPIIIDIEGYKQRRYEALQALARRIAEQVKTRRAPFTLKPMPAYERRIIHLTLADHPDVITESTDVGEARRVVILPRKQSA